VLGSEQFIEEMSRKAVGKAKKTTIVRRRELMGISPEAINGGGWEVLRYQAGASGYRVIAAIEAAIAATTAIGSGL
jgi:hypothetical protein